MKGVSVVLLSIVFSVLLVNQARAESILKEPRIAAARALRLQSIRHRTYNTAPALRGSKNRYNYSGGWHGRLLMARADCSGMPSSFLFRHIISMSKNQVRLETSSDGTLYGMSRNGGKRLETRSSYVTSSGVSVDVAVVYDNLNKNGKDADMGYAVRLTKGFQRCTGAYGAKAIRAFY